MTLDLILIELRLDLNIFQVYACRRQICSRFFEVDFSLESRFAPGAVASRIECKLPAALLYEPGKKCTQESPLSDFSLDRNTDRPILFDNGWNAWQR